MNQSTYFFIPFSSSGLTIRIEALVGSISAYISDENCRPSPESHSWTSLITYYDDVFLQPSPYITISRGHGRALYIALNGVNSVNNFTVDTTIGDTSIRGIFSMWPVI